MTDGEALRAPGPSERETADPEHGFAFPCEPDVL